jgi:hypothetical protein
LSGGREIGVRVSGTKRVDGFEKVVVGVVMDQDSRGRRFADSGLGNISVGGFGLFEDKS